MSKRGKATAAALVMLGPLLLGPLSWGDTPAAPSGGTVSDAGAIAFYDEVPCANTPERPRPKRTHQVHRRRVAHAAPRVRAAKLKTHALAHRVRRHRPVTLHRMALVQPHRCTVLHHDRLTKADFAYDPVEGGGSLEPTQPYTYSKASGAPRDYFGGRSAPARDLGPGFGGGGGGGGGLTATPGPSPVAAAPEPETWLLMILGVGLAGAALRRRRNEEGRLQPA